MIDIKQLKMSEELISLIHKHSILCTESIKRSLLVKKHHFSLLKALKSNKTKRVLVGGEREERGGNNGQETKNYDI